MKENYLLSIDYTVVDFNGEIHNCRGLSPNLKHFWHKIEQFYPDAISVEIESITIEW